MIRYRKEENIDKAFYDKYLTDALTSLARYHLNMFFILDSSKKPEYVEFEQYIKENARDVYDGSRSRTLIVLRITRNLLYKPMCWWGKRKVKMR